MTLIRLLSRLHLELFYNVNIHVLFTKRELLFLKKEKSFWGDTDREQRELKKEDQRPSLALLFVGTIIIRVVDEHHGGRGAAMWLPKKECLLSVYLLFVKAYIDFHLCTLCELKCAIHRFVRLLFVLVVRRIQKEQDNTLLVDGRIVDKLEWNDFVSFYLTKYETKCDEFANCQKFVTRAHPLLVPSDLRSNGRQERKRKTKIWEWSTSDTALVEILFSFSLSLSLPTARSTPLPATSRKPIRSRDPIQDIKKICATTLSNFVLSLIKFKRLYF